MYLRKIIWQVWSEFLAEGTVCTGKLLDETDYDRSQGKGMAGGTVYVMENIISIMF